MMLRNEVHYSKSRRTRGRFRKKPAPSVAWPSRAPRLPGRLFTYRDMRTNELGRGSITTFTYAGHTYDAVLDRLGEPVAVITYHPLSNTWYAATPRHHGLERRTDVELAIALLSDPPV